MLDQNDLRMIGALLDEKLETKLEEKLEEKLAPMKNDIRELKERLAPMEKDIGELKERLAPIAFYGPQRSRFRFGAAALRSKTAAM